MKSIQYILLPSLALAACDNRTSYYNSEGAVQVSGVDISEQEGNVGGNIINVAGSGFGSDPAAVTVMIGNQNAKVVSITDALIEVIVPHGPIQGGPVDVRVGNSQGQSSLEEGYTYKLPGNGMNATWGEVGSENQIAYVSVANDYLSCYAGVGNGTVGGCEGVAYTGDAGVEGRSEALEFVYPHAQNPYALGKAGFGNSTTHSWNQWTVTPHPHDIVSFDDENSVEDFRIKLDEFKLKNLSDNFGGTFCANLPSQANFYYSGDSDYVPTATSEFGGGLLYPELADAGYKRPPVSVSGSGDLTVNYGNGDSCYIGAKEYAIDELVFCMTDEYERGETLSYEAERPFTENFFQGTSASGALSDTVPVDINLTIKNANIDQTITLPPYVQFSDTAQGFNENWAIQSIDGNCPDSNGDRLTEQDDALLNWTWSPVDWDEDCTRYELAYEECMAEDDSDSAEANCASSAAAAAENAVCIQSGIKGISTYIKVTISHLGFSWIGGEGVTQMATITVPDDNNFDPETGLSSLALPSWVMYSFPTATNDYGEAQAQFGEGTIWNGYGQFDGEYGLMIIAIDRITEYTLPVSVDTQIGGNNEQVNGDMVFAYSTGDMGFFSFNNPLDSTNPCDDCIDNDGDGWTDVLDPDCVINDNGVIEGNEYYLHTSSTCNDGIDNDGDGLIDVEDDDCQSGASGESFDCSNRIDDDNDGWTDQEDPDCQNGIFENNQTAPEYCSDETFTTEEECTANGGTWTRFTCNDAQDNDEDGWIDSEDPACTTALEAETDGYGSTQCNDGQDNDGFGDIDSDDVYCDQNGALSAEAPEMGDLCSDNIDNDGDGTIDGLDSSCGGLCSDGIDNDGDGYIDNADPSCELTNGNTETPTTYDTSNERFASLGDCVDGVDNDCDGFIDALDPACSDSNGTNGYLLDESADGNAGDCNCDDELDNDADGWTDLDDPDCDGSGYGTESGIGESACNDGLDNDNDGLVDAFDAFCQFRGADEITEAPTNLLSSCNDESDNDGDGYIDLLDPSCEKSNGATENGGFDTSFWNDPQCFNEIDDDGDGDIDGLDAGCEGWSDPIED